MSTPQERNPQASASERVLSARAATRRNRLRLVGMTIVVQAILLGAGLGLALRYARAQTIRAIERYVLEQNVRTAEVVGGAIRQMDLQSVEYGTPEWERLQSMIEGVRLSAEGFVCVLDGEGRVLCHPALRRNPELRGTPMAHKVIRSDGEGDVAIGSAPSNRTIAGRLRMDKNDVHYVATAALPGLGGRITVHQPEAGLSSAGTLAAAGFGTPFVLAGGVVVVLTGVIGASLVRRHDRALERINQGLEAEIAEGVRRGVQTRDALIRGLAKLADYRDTDTGTHLDRISEYSALLAETLRDQYEEIDDEWIRTLRTASSLHDIGKVGIPDSILLKPGKLTAEERRIMERHPIIGTDTLIAVRETMGHDDLVEMSLRIALYHHERWDGEGYPMRLVGKDVPLEARIVALADVYDALTSARVYKDAMPHGRVVGMIRESAGTQFDPAVIEAFLKVEGEFDTVRRRLQPTRTPIGPRDAAAAA